MIVRSMEKRLRAPALALFAAAFSVGLASVALAGKVRLSPEGTEALGVLLHASRFTDDRIGDAPVTPPEVEALRTLWGEPHAAEAFRHILRTGSVPGRLFALCGLYYAAPDEFDEVVRHYR